MIKYDENFDAYKTLKLFTMGIGGMTDQELMLMVAHIPIKKVIDRFTKMPSHNLNSPFTSFSGLYVTAWGHYSLHEDREVRCVVINFLSNPNGSMVPLFQLTDDGWVTCVDFAPEQIDLKCIEKMIEAAQSLLNFE